MRFSDLPIKRPVTTAMLFAALSLLGLISLERLPVELLPEVIVRARSGRVESAYGHRRDRRVGFIDDHDPGGDSCRV